MEPHPQSYEDSLSFDDNGRERSRPPRSIPESEVEKISRNARKRVRGERFPSEDDGEQIPSAPMPDDAPSSSLDIFDKLSDRQKSDIANILTEFPECFSDGSTIGHIDPEFFKATIELNGPIPRHSTIAQWDLRKGRLSINPYIR